MSKQPPTKVPEAPVFVAPDLPPFGLPLIWGPKGAGKTLVGLNSPWQPVHVVDSEDSSKDYFEHQTRLIEMGFIRGPFTRTAVATLTEYSAECGPKGRIETENLQFGTIMLDTFGQMTQWMSEFQFAVKDKAIADKQSQIVWGHLRDNLRNTLIRLQRHCKLLIVTAHARKYNEVWSPRCNPAALELSAISVMLFRQPNNKLPEGRVMGARLPFFPPQIPQFTLEKLCTYIQQPADWDKLAEDEKQEKTEAPVVLPLEDRELEEG